MPHVDALLKAVKTLSSQMTRFHKDFKQSIYYLVNVLTRDHNAGNGDSPATPSQPSQIDLFPTQSAAQNSDGRAPFKFLSDEKEKETEFDDQINKCINSVAAEWKKLTKLNATNTPRSIRNSALSSKYKEWLRMEPPFFVRRFRPTISEPANLEIDSIRLEQAKGFVENECRVMSLHAKNAQKNNEDVDTQMKALIDSMTKDEKLKDALHRCRNETKIDGETRELKKWQEKEKWFDQLPTNPSLEDKEDWTVQSKKGPPAQSKKGPSGDVTTESHAGKKSKPKPPQAKHHKKQKGATDSNSDSSRGNARMHIIPFSWLK